jgi:hypothetical protein
MLKQMKKGVELYQNRKYNLLIQQNKNAILKEITFADKQPDQIVYLDKKYLLNGVKSIRLID